VHVFSLKYLISFSSIYGGKFAPILQIWIILLLLLCWTDPLIYNAYLIATFTKESISHSITEFHIFKYFKIDIHWLKRFIGFLLSPTRLNVTLIPLLWDVLGMQLMLRFFRNIVHKALLGDFSVNLGTSLNLLELCLQSNSPKNWE